MVTAVARQSSRSQEFPDFSLTMFGFCTLTRVAPWLSERCCKAPAFLKSFLEKKNPVCCAHISYFMALYNQSWGLQLFLHVAKKKKKTPNCFHSLWDHWVVCFTPSPPVSSSLIQSLFWGPSQTPGIPPPSDCQRRRSLSSYCGLRETESVCVCGLEALVASKYSMSRVCRTHKLFLLQAVEQKNDPI